MNTINIKVKKLASNAIIPEYQTDGAACFDIHACFANPEADYCISHPGTPAVIRTGLAFEIPPGFVMKVYSRSGHGFKNDVRLANAVGVIDSDYRGELMVKLTNDNSDGQGFKIRHGDRIAQAMIIPIPRINFIESDELSDTERGNGGFGSTGH